MSSNAGFVNASTPSAQLPARSQFHVLMLPDFDRAHAIGDFAEAFRGC